MAMIEIAINLASIAEKAVADQDAVLAVTSVTD